MRYRINPLVLIFYNIVYPLLAMFVYGRCIDIYFFVVSSLFLVYMKKFRRLFIIWIFCAVFYAGYRVFQFSGIEVLEFIGLMLMMFVRFMPCYIIASILIYDYQTSEIISALELLHIPKPIVIGLTITIRYIPTFRNELRYINESMRLRGIRFGGQSMLKSFSYFVVPQLFRCMILADELTSAGLCKGIDREQSRSSYYDIHFRWQDALLLAIIGTGLIGVLLWIKV